MESCTKLKIGQVFSVGDPESKHMIFQSGISRLRKDESGQCFLECHLCGEKLNEPVAFWDHVSRIHGVQKEDYSLFENLEVSTQNTTNANVPYATLNDDSRGGEELNDGSAQKEQDGGGVGQDGTPKTNVSEDTNKEFTLEGNCAMCDERVLASQIWVHVLHKHGLRPEEYRTTEKTLMEPEKAQIDAENQGTSSSVSSARESSDFTENACTITSVGNSHTKVLKGRRRIRRRGVQKNKAKGLVVNECKFKCTVCPKVYNSWSTTMNHLKICEHYTSLLEQFDEIKPEEFTVQRKYHKCMSCGEELLKDNQVIYEHISRVHKLFAHSYRKLASADTASGSDPTGEPADEQAVEGAALILRNACTFQCLVAECSMVFNGWAKMRKHLGVKHPELLTKFTKCNAMDYVVRKSWHQCVICEKKLLHDKAVIMNHLRRHRISRLEKYEREWNKRCGYGVKEVQTEPPKQVPPTRSVRVHAAEEGKAPRSNVELSSVCRFRCGPCKLIFNSWASTTNHLRNKHGGIGKRNTHDINEYVIERHHHNCILCGKELLQDLRLIRSHLGGAHKMQLSEYKQLLLHKDASPDLLGPPHLGPPHLGPPHLEPPHLGPPRLQPQTRQPRSSIRSKTRRETNTPKGDDKTPDKARKAQEDEDGPKMDPRVLNLDMVKSFQKQNSFECSICGRIFRNAGAATSNRHVVLEHGINLVQYIRMTSPDIELGKSKFSADLHAL